MMALRHRFHSPKALITTRPDSTLLEIISLSKEQLVPYVRQVIEHGQEPSIAGFWRWVVQMNFATNEFYFPSFAHASENRNKEK